MCGRGTAIDFKGWGSPNTNTNTNTAHLRCTTVAACWHNIFCIALWLQRILHYYGLQYIGCMCSALYCYNATMWFVLLQTTIYSALYCGYNVVWPFTQRKTATALQLAGGEERCNHLNSQFKSSLDSKGFLFVAMSPSSADSHFSK